MKIGRGFFSQFASSEVDESVVKELKLNRTYIKEQAHKKLLKFFCFKAITNLHGPFQFERMLIEFAQGKKWRFANLLL